MSDLLRIAIVDDHPLVREGVAHAIDGSGQARVVAQGSTAQEAIQIVRDHDPDVLLLDLSLPGSGLSALREIAQSGARTKVVILTVSEENGDVLEALRSGASGYILKGISGTELRSAIQRVHGAGSYVSPELGARMLADISRNVEVVNAKRSIRLSEREHEVCRLVRRGLCNKEIGSKLDISEKTVKHYLTNIFKKLDVRNRTELALLD
ncbi:response regulator [Rubellimicrobium aerolatum]|uniref:Response regulator n=1 Tax=Rubellimicrobium aerolatum TaxID=490979 RepID=A0ABW0SHJ3_9RHOB|nr:response regulator transcription factor [Rubellimicrobium aerolatum]MBP1807419.1 DNA-binding NarL/FixJ family response regulator [Rubellimicrobium aerolatum]